MRATQRLLELARRHGTRRFVYTSSFECGFHAHTCVDVDEETHPYVPLARLTRMESSRA